MGDYFRYAFVNLSAVSAHDTHEGFLNLRQLPPATSLSNGLYVRPGRPSWGSFFSKAPLMTRAWVLQERLMSPRIIHFSNGETF